MSTPEQIKNILDEKKAEAITVLNVHPVTSICDYMIIATGTSGPHLSALTESVVELAKKQKIEILGIEGLHEREWILIDLGNILIHLMLQNVRDYYELEKLWAE